MLRLSQNYNDAFRIIEYISHCSYRILELMIWWWMQVLECHECPRVFHQRCVQHHPTTVANWLCPECVAVRNAEKHNRLSANLLREMLDFAMERIKTVVDSEPFFKPVNTDEFPHYEEYVIYPVDISHLELNIKKKVYTSTRAFLAEFRWILHNCIIFNSTHSKLTNTARTLMKVNWS